MGVLFMMPNWAVPSELWMQRMIEAVADQTVCLATNRCAEASWQGRIAALTLADQAAPLWRRGLRRLGLSTAQPRSRLEVLRRRVQRPDVTVILAHYLDFTLEFEEVWRTTDKPLFVHCHGYDTIWDLRHFDRPQQRVFDANYPQRVRWLAQRATLIANSHTCARRLQAIGVPPERVVVKPLGVHVPARPPNRAPHHGGTLNLLYLGRLTECKGPELTIEAFDLACRQGLNARLILAGDGELRTACQHQRARSAWAARVHLVGAVDRAAGERLLARADILTAHHRVGPLAGQDETFGVALVEAMAAGLPIVTGRSGSVPEVAPEGQASMLFDPGDVPAHAQALLRLATDAELRQRLGRGGWEKAAGHYTAEREAQALRQLLAGQSFAPALQPGSREPQAVARAPTPPREMKREIIRTCAESMAS